MDIRNTCQTCGSGAYREIKGVFIRCSKCKQSARHVYCLEMSPLVYFQDAQTWCCEDCRGQDPITFFYDEDDDNRSDDFGTMEAEEVMPISTDKKLKTVLEATLEGNEEAEEEKIDRASINDLPDIALDTDENEDSAYPVCRPTWTGDLKIHNKVKKVRRIVMEVDAHRSIMACANVLEAAKLLKPERLDLDFVRRSDVWPKWYDVYKPNDKSIALYIFPKSETDDETNGTIFKELARRMAKEDLAMKMRVGSDEKAELLVFTSRLLPKGERRMNFHSYLWGVFKEKVSISQ